MPAQSNAIKMSPAQVAEQRRLEREAELKRYADARAAELAAKEQKRKDDLAATRAFELAKIEAENKGKSLAGYDIQGAVMSTLSGLSRGREIQ